VFLQYHLQCQASRSSWPFVLLIVGVIRSLSCGGWVYITSTDHHDAHDVLMVSYIICNVPWMFGSISYTPSMRLATKRQRFVNRVRRYSPYSHQTENTSPQRLSSRSQFTISFSSIVLTDSLPPSSPWYTSSSSTRSTRDLGVSVPGHGISQPYVRPFSLHEI
jgi:hypothetical protein